MTFSIAGFVGAAVGLAMALVTYLATEPHLARRDAKGEPHPQAGLIRAFLYADFIMLAVVGYVVGDVLRWVLFD